MPTKKLAKKKPKQNGVAIDLNGSAEMVMIAADNLLVTIERDQSKPPRPVRLPGESEEERAKRLADRKARTIKAFQMAYEDHQRRKAGQ